MCPHIIGRLGGVETESDLLCVVGGAAHCVERVPCYLIWRQIVDGVVPQHETCPSLGQGDLYPPFVPGTGFPDVQHHHRDPGEFQLPVLVGGGFEV